MTVVVASLIVLAGCAAPRSGAEGSGPTPPPQPTTTAPPETTPPNPPTGLPTLRPPSEPPRTATDQLPSDVVVGWITLGGSGPCYRLVTDDGQPWALYGDEGMTVAAGTTVIVKIKPLVLAINCGPGEHAHIVKMEIVR